MRCYQNTVYTNGDGYTDILFLIQDQPNEIWLNDQKRGFYDSGQRLDKEVFGVNAACGDLDHDVDTDIIIATGPVRKNGKISICPNQLWMNHYKQDKLTLLS